MNHFWAWNKLDGDPDGDRELAIEGVIASESWYQDEVTPAIFRAELFSGEGNVVVRINSPGGDCFAAAQIYDMLREYKGNVTVRITGIAASAASVIAMAGDTVTMTPVGMLMIHNPSTIALGNRVELLKALGLLDECRESLVNAYELKSGLPRQQIMQMMDDETWISSQKALDLHLIDAVHITDKEAPAEDKGKKKCAAACAAMPVFACSMREAQQNTLNRLLGSVKPDGRQNNLNRLPGNMNPESARGFATFGEAINAGIADGLANPDPTAAALAASVSEAAATTLGACASIGHKHIINSHTHAKDPAGQEPGPTDAQRAAFALRTALANASL